MIDQVIVSLFLISMLATGLNFRSKGTNLKSFTNLGSDINANKLILTATIFASAVGGGTTFGITEKTYNSNLAFAYALILTIPVDIFIAYYFVPKLVKYKNLSTPGEIIGKYYGKNARAITGLSAFLISIGFLSVQIAVSGKIFSYLFKINYIYAVIASYIIVISYTTIGGFRSVVINNVFQFFAMIIGIPLVSILCIKTLGFDYIINNVDSNKYDIFNNSNLLSDTFFAALTFSVMGMNPSYIQRIIAGSNSFNLKKAVYFKSAIYALFISCIAFNGLISTLIDENLNSSKALLVLIDIVIPVGLKGVVIIGLLASVMSTADSDLNTSSISFVNDFLNRFIKTNSNKLLFYTKLFTIFIGSSVILIVLKFNNILDIIIFTAGFWAPVSLCPLLFILNRKIISMENYYLSVTSGISSFIIFEIIYESSKINGVFAGTIASLLVYALSKKENL